MIKTLAGPNTYLMKHELDALVAEFLREHDALALERIDGQEAELAQIREAVTSLPFLAAKKMVILRAPSTQKSFTEQIEQLADEISDTTDVVIFEPKVDKRSTYYKFLKAKTDFHEYGELDQYALATWLVATAKEQGATLSLKDASYLVERVGTNQQALGSELEKLGVYNSDITKQTIDALTEAAPQSTIFELLEAAFAGNLARAVGLYAEQRALKVEPAQIIAMLAWQLHILALIKSGGDRSIETIAKEARLSPYVVRKSQSIARRLTLAKLKALIADLLVIDKRMKRESIDADEALQHYLLKLAA